MRRRDLPFEFLDCLFEVGIVPNERERGPALHERRGNGALPLEHVGQSANRRKVLRRGTQHLLELLLRVLVLVELDERASESYARGQISRVRRQARAADIRGFVKHRRAAVLFRELRKSNRRRVLLDPSSEIFKT